jgi:hypothetical protein
MYALYVTAYPRELAYVPRCDDGKVGQRNRKERLAMLLEEDNGICL